MSRASITITFVAVMLVSGCRRNDQPPANANSSARDKSTTSSSALTEARRAFVTKLTKQSHTPGPTPQPPAELFRLVQYSSPVGLLDAYLSIDPRDQVRHPAMLWITGGDCNTIGDVSWADAERENDQSAAAFRRSGMIMMYPSLRGGNNNPGVHEGFYGEVDDILAAADFLARQPYVDPQRIYLGGHSSGGTMVLLVAECSARFRAVFSFGPVGNPVQYGAKFGLPFDLHNKEEARLRSPIQWLTSIRSPTFVFEGADGPVSNAADVRAIKRAAAKNSLVHCFCVKGANHFTILAPLNELIARKLRNDRGATVNLEFTLDELNAAVK